MLAAAAVGARPRVAADLFPSPEQTNLTLFAASADAAYKFYRIPALLRVATPGQAWLLAFAEGRQQPLARALRDEDRCGPAIEVGTSASRLR